MWSVFFVEPVCKHFHSMDFPANLEMLQSLFFVEPVCKNSDLIKWLNDDLSRLQSLFFVEPVCKADEVLA